MSDSVQPHRWQPTRLPRPWDSPGKNTGVGCHFLLQCVKVKSESEVAQLCLTRGDPMDSSLPGSFIHGIFQARVLEWGAIAFSSPWSSYKESWNGEYYLASTEWKTLCSAQVENVSKLKWGGRVSRKPKLMTNSLSSQVVPFPTPLFLHIQLYFVLPSSHNIHLPSPLLLLLSHFSHVRLCVTPQMAAHQAPPSLGFSRQEHRSGLPLPSPMHESEK